TSFCFFLHLDVEQMSSGLANLFNRPRSVGNSYREYKHQGKRLVRWMLSRAQELGIKSLDPKPPTIAPAPQSTKPKKNRKKGPRGPVDEPTLPVKLTTSQLLTLATKIVDLADSIIPREVIELLEANIKLREKVAESYQGYSTIPEVKESNDRHAHFTGCLKKIRDILKGRGHPRADDQQQLVTRFSNMDIMSLIGLGTEDENRPLDDFNLISDFDDDIDDVQLSAWFLFYDLQRLREYIRETWTDYGVGKLSLITASITTTQTVEIVKEMETDFFERFGQRFKANRDYIAAVMAMLNIDARTDLERLRDFIMAATWVGIWKFGGVLQQGFFGIFNPDAKRSSMSQQERDAEDVCLLMSHLPDVATQAMLSGSGRGKKKAWGHTIDEESLVQDLRHFIDNPKRPIPVHLVFQWDLWRDIVIINRRYLQRPLNELHSITRSIVHSAQNWIDAFEDRFYTENEVSGLKTRAKEMLVDNLRSMVLEDPQDIWKREQGIDDGTPFQLFLYNPWACGIAAATSLFLAHNMSVQIINGSGYLASVIQLYNALLQHGKVAHWPHMDRLLDICSSTIYKGGAPKIGSFLKAFNVSVGEDPALMQGRIDPNFKKTGHGTGVFPAELGGSVLAQLALKGYQLSDDIIMRLFPRPGHDAVSKQRFRPRQETAHFGGKQCEPFILLDALKQRAETDIKSTGLTIDLFSAQRMSLAIMRRWHTRSGKLFAEIFGPKYQERPGQMGFLVGYLFMVMEAPPSLLPSAIPAGAVDKIIEEAVKAIEEGREDLEIGIMKGAKISYVP
ncbi:hypothetical protein BD779DRAFT_1572993, partial [Infundibulicybe gibba]